VETWDFFIAHAGPDAKLAADLHNALKLQDDVTVFLDARQLAPGEPWQVALKAALSRSRVSVVLISPHTDDAWYQQEEIALAIDLVRDEAIAHTIVPVFLPGVDRRKAPYGLSRVHAIMLGEKSLDAAAAELVATLRGRPLRPSTGKLAGAVAMTDELWTRMEPALTGVAPRGVSGLGTRFVADGEDLVARQQGVEKRRVTRAEFENLLSPEQLELVEVLEKSMEINKALWKRKYPNRTLQAADRAAAEDAARAMAEDLEGVLSIVEQARLWLDDHYVTVRQIVGQYRQA